MGAFAISGSVSKTEFAGEYQHAFVDLTTDAATGTYTFADFEEVEVLSAFLNGDPAAGCSSVTAKVDNTDLNKVNVKVWKDNYTAADANFAEVRIVIRGQYKTNS